LSGGAQAAAGVLASIPWRCAGAQAADIYHRSARSGLQKTERVTGAVRPAREAGGALSRLGRGEKQRGERRCAPLPF